MSRLEAQLHEAAKASQSPSTPRTWANISVHDSHASCSAAAKASTSSSATAQLPAAGHSRAGSRGGQAACTETVSDPPAKPRVVPNQLPRGGDFATMRQTLEKQQRAATIVLVGNPSKQVRASCTSCASCLFSFCIVLPKTRDENARGPCSWRFAKHTPVACIGMLLLCSRNLRRTQHTS